jgi:hypothetical protein
LSSPTEYAIIKIYQPFSPTSYRRALYQGKGGNLLRAKKILYAFVITVLTIVLIVLVSSRNAEKDVWPTALSGSPDSAAFSPTNMPALDNDTTNIAQAEITPTPAPTPVPTVYKPDIDINSWQYVLVNADHSIGSYVPDVEAIENTRSI